MLTGRFLGARRSRSAFQGPAQHAAASASYQKRASGTACDDGRQQERECDGNAYKGRTGGLRRLPLSLEAHLVQTVLERPTSTKKTKETNALDPAGKTGGDAEQTDANGDTLLMI